VRARFLEVGLVKVERAFDPDDAARMRGVFWREAARRAGAVEADPSTWPQGPLWRLRSSKHHHAFGALATPALGAALDELLGAGTWSWPSSWGQVLATFPSAHRWRLPSSLWHLDHPFGERVDPLPAVHVFACFGPVVSHGGATAVVAGSHHLVARFVAERPRMATCATADARRAFHAWHPWLRALSDDRDVTPDRWERFSAATDLDGASIRVVELTGEPGDVWLMHPMLLHHTTTNAAGYPRLVRHQAIRRPDATTAP
jgi:hypothetical protein